MSSGEDDDDLLALLGARASEIQDERHAAWSRVYSGERSANEVADERAAAGDRPEEIEFARQLYQPSAKAKRNAMIDRLLEQARADDNGQDDDVVEEPPVERPDGSRGRSWFLLGLGLAAALLLLIILGPVRRHYQAPRSHGDDQPFARVEALPDYGIETDRGLASERGGPSTVEPRAPLRYRPSTPIRWRLRPERAVEGVVEVRAFARSSAGTILELELGDVLSVDDRGIVSFETQASTLGLGAGQWTVCFVLSRSALATQDAEELLNGDPEGLVVIEQPITMLGQR